MTFPIFHLANSGKTFELFKPGDSYLPGVAQLNRILTINSISVSPTFVYYGGAANGTNWTAEVGETLTLQSGTVPSYNQGSPLLGTDDDSVKFNAGGYYAAAGTSFAQITTEDIVFETVFKHRSLTGAQGIISTRVAGAGWLFYINSNVPIFFIQDASGTAQQLGAASSLVDGCWYHSIWFVNRDGSCQGYLNGVSNGLAVDFSARQLTLSSGAAFTVGSYSGGGTPCSSNIGYAAIWKSTNWLDTHLQATIASERFTKLTGFYPSIALGTKLPTTATRNSVAMLDKVEEITTPGTELLTDGDMEAADAAAWTSQLSAVLSKETNPRTGSVGAKCLRVAYGGANNPIALQVCVVSGNKYRVTGWARGDGTYFPLFDDSAATRWSGTTSTNWQYFDLIFTAGSSAGLRLRSNATGAGYVEFDDVSIYLIPAGATDHSILSDGAMEDTEVDAWTAANSSTLTKQTGTRTGGSGSRILRTTYNGTNYPGASQIILTIGYAYRITGWARGDGTYNMYVYGGSTQLWFGTSSTDWQYFDEVFTANGIGVVLQSRANGASGYTEFDDVELYQLPTRYLYKTGANWMRYVGRIDKNAVALKGYLAEASVASKILYSESFGANAWFPIDTGDGILDDADMEIGNVDSWASGNNAVLTKEANPRTGSVGAQCLKVKMNGTSYPRAAQSTLSAGIYRVTGWCKGDGTAVPRIGGENVGTSSTDWQYFDIKQTYTDANFFLYAFTTTDTTFVEFDDIMIYPLAIAPTKETNAVSLIADSTDGEHGLTQDVTLTAVVHTFSVFAKKGNKDWLYLSDDTVATATAYFNISAGVLGTVGAGCTAYIENWGGGWMRCSITFTGTVAAHTFKIQSAHADTDNTFAGDGAAVNVYLFGSQIEIGEYMTSYIPTTSAAVTRAAEVLQYKGDDGNVSNNQMGTVVCDVLKEDQDLQTDMYFLGLSDGGSGTDRLSFFHEATGDVVRIFGSSAESGDGSIDTRGTTDAVDGAIHSLRATWKTNDFQVYTDDTAEGTPDTEATAPNDIDRIEVGSLYSGVSQLNGVISNLQIFRKIKKP